MDKPELYFQWYIMAAPNFYCVFKKWKNLLILGFLGLVGNDVVLQDPRHLHVYRPSDNSDEARPRITLWGLIVYILRVKRGQIIKVYSKFTWNELFGKFFCK